MVCFFPLSTQHYMAMFHIWACYSTSSRGNELLYAVFLSSS